MPCHLQENSPPVFEYKEGESSLYLTSRLQGFCQAWHIKWRSEDAFIVIRPRRMYMIIPVKYQLPCVCPQEADAHTEKGMLELDKHFMIILWCRAISRASRLVGSKSPDRCCKEGRYKPGRHSLQHGRHRQKQQAECPRQWQHPYLETPGRGVSDCPKLPFTHHPPPRRLDR